ncbi:hypothetical protein BO71DRAFT_398096 [Aspergillus ellipticus CBS 707.79]|uniref:FHA domain-containing protein n=1 Tax=Aspergillus ellipticus CBS 707.79 TaxID=1448320 RepID=A0A319DDE8_9EURO|nr:hypothetical protein BO71DRAFT_398096 [Aspergillus ellipticus CBS 707.79]
MVTMPVPQAVVNLRPLGLHDDPPYRSLKFTSGKTYANIGRASKRESKNLVPAAHNGLFDSRVMSRNHARIWANLDEKLLYIRDGGSMHGTWVNEKKIPTDEDIVIKHGDVVTFGSTVVRGTDTFPPLKVRCEIEWPIPAPRPVLATNTFCVPEDDESEVKQDALPASCVAESVSENDNSISYSDSDDHSVMEVSSPLTSPPKKDDPEKAQRIACLDLTAGDDLPNPNGSQESPINLDCEQSEQPLVTPRMTPPSVADIPEGPSGTIHHFIISGSRDVSDEDDYSWDDENEHAVSDDDLESRSSLSSEAEQASDEDVSGGSNSRVLGIRELLVPDANIALEETNSHLDSEDEGAHSDGGDRYESLDKNLAYGDELPGIINPWNLRATTNPGYALHTPPIPKVPYHDGPFVDNDSLRLGNHTPLFDVNPGLIALGTAIAEYKRSEAPLIKEKNTQNEATTVPERQTSMPSSLAQDPDPERDLGAVKDTRTLKRKADDFDSLFSESDITVFPRATMEASPSKVNASGETSYGETCLPDAQPEISMDKLETPSQLTDLETVNECMVVDGPSLEVGDAERPSKRPKTSSAGSIASHAATAALGVAIGAFGTIAALASLPPNYFQ